VAAERLLLWRLVPFVSPVAELHPAAAGSATDCRRSCLELLQDWDAQQKAQRERILAGWKPDDEEEEDKDSGEHCGWIFAGGVVSSWPAAAARTCTHVFGCQPCPTAAPGLMHSLPACLPSNPSPVPVPAHPALPAEEEDELPFACLICRRLWAEAQDPVVTRCKHYFCEQCALQHNAKTAKCFACEQPTGGIFNVAHDILRREKAKKRKEAGGGSN
jgi:hypothetical protein